MSLAAGVPSATVDETGRSIYDGSGPRISPVSPQPRDARAEAPIQAEPGAMPANNGFRLDDDERVGPSIPERAQRHPEEPVAAFEAGPGMLALEHRELLAQDENLQTEVVAGAEEGKQVRRKCGGKLDHEPGG